MRKEKGSFSMDPNWLSADLRLKYRYDFPPTFKVLQVLSWSLPNCDIYMLPRGYFFVLAVLYHKRRAGEIGRCGEGGGLALLRRRCLEWGCDSLMHVLDTFLQNTYSPTPKSMISCKKFTPWYRK